ncbi:MAG: hypothetical protein LBR38_02015 [Synergistaceae bacterium]|nr:hypothetical protein [Synergistaceae bacterium]
MLGWLIGCDSVNLAPMFFMPVIWMFSVGRLGAYLTPMSYLLAASYGLVTSAPRFFGLEDQPMLGPAFPLYAVYLGLLWLLPAIVFALPWALLWTRKHSSFSSLLARLLVIMAIIILPPVGLTWGNPLLCAGYLFPYTAELGIAAVVLLWVALWRTSGRARAVAVASVALYVAFMSPQARLTPRVPPDWDGIYTSFGKLYSGSDDSVGPYVRYQILSIILRNSKAKYVVLPETVAGWWGNVTEMLWSDSSRLFEDGGRTFFVGAEETAYGTMKYINLVHVRGANTGSVVQRFPVPFSMWRPWSDTGAVADWFGGAGMTRVDGMKVGVLICFEPYLYLPCLTTAASRPDVLVAVSNQWWARGTNIPALSDKCIASWALLYNLPVVLAKNI